MTSENKIKITALVVTVFFLTALGMGIYHVNVNDVLKKDLTTEKLRSEKLLSEKLNLDKQIQNFKNNISALQGKSAHLDKMLKEASDKIADREKAIAQLNREKASLISFKKEAQALATIKEDLLRQVAELTNTNKELNNQLMVKDQALASIRKEQKDLMAKYSKLEQEKIFADNFRIESMKKKNEKLTVKARKTKNVVVSFDVPEHLAQTVNDKTFRLELKKPVGVQVMGEQIVTLVDVEESVLTASADDTMYLGKKIKRATISFKPTEKLQQGIYTVSIYEGKELLGNAQIRLMK